VPKRRFEGSGAVKVQLTGAQSRRRTAATASAMPFGAIMRATGTSRAALEVRGMASRIDPAPGTIVTGVFRRRDRIARIVGVFEQIAGIWPSARVR
jgi:hypothetical protein